MFNLSTSGVIHDALGDIVGFVPTDLVPLVEQLLMPSEETLLVDELMAELVEC